MIVVLRFWYKNHKSFELSLIEICVAAHYIFQKVATDMLHTYFDCDHAN